MKVLPLPSSLYARWRLKCAPIPELREESDAPPERLLQAIWQHQRLQRNGLRTLDGRSVRILHPGFLNLEGGPDFRGAVIQFDDEPPRSGDVEVDIQANGWRAHGHDCNPAFQKVILHVIWDGARKSEEAPSRLVIRDKLDAPLAELSIWLNSEGLKLFPASLRGRCCAPLRELAAQELFDLLREAAQIRFQAKAFHLKARAKQVGWDQTLYEGLFRALGYKHNAWPMQRLAELRSRWSRGNPSPFEVQTRLYGIAGLLPLELTRSRSAADGYLRRVWDLWWREREEFSDCILPRSVWRFHGLRPANHPQRRIALASHWAASKKLIQRIERWSTMAATDSCAGELLEVLRAGPDEFWEWHWTFKSACMAKRQPLLGTTRVTDLAINVILPWLWVRAIETGDSETQRRMEDRFNSWPAAEDNSLLRTARQRLLGARTNRIHFGAAEQQGLMQIVRDFCEQSNAICADCQFPQLVKTTTTMRAARS